MRYNNSRWGFLEDSRSWNLHGATTDTAEERAYRRLPDEDSQISDAYEQMVQGNKLVDPIMDSLEDNWLTKVGFWYRFHGGQFNHTMTQIYAAPFTPLGINMAMEYGSKRFKAVKSIPDSIHTPFMISGMFASENVAPSIKEMVDSGTYITKKMLDATLNRAVSGFTDRTWCLEYKDIVDKTSDIDILDNDDETFTKGKANHTGMISIPAGSDPMLVEALKKGMRPILNGWNVKKGTWHTSNHDHQMEQCQEIMIAKWAATVDETVMIVEDKFHENTVQAYVERTVVKQEMKVSTLVNTMQDRRRKNETRKGMTGYGVSATKTISMTLDMGMKNGVGGDSNGSDQMEFIDNYWNPERLIGVQLDVEYILPKKISSLDFKGCNTIEELATKNGIASRTIRRWVEEAKKKMK